MVGARHLVIGLLAVACSPSPPPEGTSVGGTFASGGRAGSTQSSGACASGEPTPGCPCFAGERVACPCDQTLTCPANEQWTTACSCDVPVYDASDDFGPAGDDAPLEDSSPDDSGGDGSFTDADALADVASVLCIAPDGGAEGGSCPQGSTLDSAGCCRPASLACVYPLPNDAGVCAPGSLLSDTTCTLDALRKCAPCASILVRTVEGGVAELALVSDAGTCPVGLVPNNGCCAPAAWVDGGETTRP